MTTRFLRKYRVTACDGTGMFSSESVHCESCCEQNAMKRFLTDIRTDTCEGEKKN